MENVHQGVSGGHLSTISSLMTEHPDQGSLYELERLDGAGSSVPLQDCHHAASTALPQSHEMTSLVGTPGHQTPRSSRTSIPSD